MRKKLTVAVTAAFALGLGLISNTQSSETKTNHLRLSNLEALSNGEPPRFPCIASPSDKCSYEAIDAANNKVTLTSYGYRNA